MTRWITVTGGKGGVGKTQVSINLALNLQKLGHSTILVDADFGLAGIDLLLKLKPQYFIKDLIQGDCELKDLILRGPEQLSIIPGSRGDVGMGVLSWNTVKSMFDHLKNQDLNYTYGVIDTAAGITPSVLSLVKEADEILVVVCNDPASIADSYAIIKLLRQEHALHKFGVLVNMVSNQEEAALVFANISNVAYKFLDVVLHYVGFLPYDQSVLKAAQLHNAVALQYAQSLYSTKMKQIAMQLHHKNMKNMTRGSMYSNVL
ncbi:MAG: MinD/ParA family protein [Gammaproteobacteria bacterium]